MSDLHDLLDRFRAAAVTEREKGTYFEELTVAYLKNEPAYRELYRVVLPYSEWAAREGLDKRDAGIDLVAETFTGEVHAIQCKLYATDYEVRKSDIDSFFTASGKKPFTHRIIFTTTSHWSEHAEDALRGQQIPITKVDLHALETSAIDWSKFAPREVVVLKQKKTARPHQRDALAAVRHGLEDADRGKLIMACGTGKTFTSLKIAEELAGAGKRVLFLVPSLALLSQTLTEWTQESETKLQSFAVCSDSDVGKKRKKDDDAVQTFVHELQYPATTNAVRLADEMKARHDGKHMSVVYATYHSIDVVHRAQKEHCLPAFDLIVCDEAHRTTGATFDGDDESAFVRVHNAEYIHGTKRLYMTATPRIFGDVAKVKADRDNIALASMDDEVRYGKNLHVLTFNKAVTAGLLVDYKVIVLAVDAAHVDARIQKLLDDGNGLKVDDAARIIGCWKALSKQGLHEAMHGEGSPMKRAVAFCQVIERQQANARTHKVSSKQIAEIFQAVVDAYQETEPPPPGTESRPPPPPLRCEAAHVDGSMNATEKEEKIDWLKAAPPESTCRILSNVRCLSEGVDVPALDAVLFLTPRNSQIDVVQSVGRVMRKANGKARGYVVLPVVIPHGKKPEEALNDNETYRIVWQVLNALRAHDDRFDAMVNKLSLIGEDKTKMEVIAITDKISRPRRARGGEDGTRVAAARKKLGQGGPMLAVASGADGAPVSRQTTLEFDIGEIERAIYAKLVDKVGNRRHWEDWANDIAQIAQTHIGRIKTILANKTNTREIEAFQLFAEELRDDLNPSISDDDIVEMLAQHMVTKPVFDALFAGRSFATENSMSKAMQSVLDVLHEHHLETEADTLRGFYDSVKLRAEGIDSAEGKQKIVVELYDKFFRNAFPKLSERLGIVYTPVEIVDFILKSVDYLLRSEFGQTLGSKDVHVLDPFTGTGTFITRLMQSGLLSKDELARKYKSGEIHANEIVLLAYYIAAINIEAAYHDVVGGEYAPFEGICLTDTFQLYEKDDLISRVLVDNSARRTKQKKLDIRVIVGNPPYSVGQKDANDNNQNVKYAGLDARIAATYAAKSNATNKNALYDSYIRAIRWASDRVGSSGVVGFVTNAGFVEANTADGLRKCLAEEFSSLYIFHLRGNQRTAGERSRKEGGKIFGSGSRAPVAISLFVKKPNGKDRGAIFFRDVGDYLTREQKLGIVATFASVAGIATSEGWAQIQPDAHGDWLKQRDEGFGQFIVIGDKSATQPHIFENYSRGVTTARDAWAYNPSRHELTRNMTRMVATYNDDVARIAPLTRADGDGQVVDRLLTADATRISWSDSLKRLLLRGVVARFDPACMVQSVYRPFAKQWLYLSVELNERVSQMLSLFPPRGGTNRAILLKQRWQGQGHLALMIDAAAEVQVDGGSQCFPLYLYDTEPDAEESDSGLFAAAKKNSDSPTRRDAITDAGLAHFQTAYPGLTVAKEDLFYYIYGILHSAEYRERYADNLGKELPRIPRVKTAKDFRHFSDAGRALGELHVGYEKVPEYDRVTIDGPKQPTTEQYRVEKMKFARVKGEKDKTVIHYNDFITVRGIPLEAYEYVVNGKSAIEWVMERQSVTTDKDSGIVKDANAWATETVGDARYPLSLLLRVITVSLETMKIVRGLPAMSEATMYPTATEPELLMAAEPTVRES